MGEVVSLEDYKAKHSPGYIRGVILDSKVDRTPEKTHARYGWNKEEADKKVAEARKRANESVKKDYGIKGKSNG